MRIATWNINSIRSRHARAIDWMLREDVDVVAFQEIKCKPEQFPYEAFQDAGYEVVLHGLSQWNGVAIASRHPMTDVEIGFPGQPGFLKGHEGPELPIEARAIGATVEGLRLWSLYVPNGRALADPHYLYKLDWLASLRDTAAGWLADDPQAQICLMGDWNVAPLDEDVWDPGFFVGKTHVSAPERAAFQAMVDTGYADVVRPHTPGEFTYWDYTQLRFPKKQGMRIDFALASPALAARVTGAAIDREERKGKGASDHAPVLVDLTD